MTQHADTAKLLNALFDAFNAHDAAKVVSLMTDDCVFEAAAGQEAYGTRYTGKAAVRAAFENVWATMPDVQWDVQNHIYAGDRAVSEWIFRATRADGSRIDVQGCDLFTIRDGMVALEQAFRKERPVLKS